MSGVGFSLFLVALWFSSVSSALTAQNAEAAMPPDSSQLDVDAKSPKSSEADRLFEQGKQQFYQGRFQNALKMFQQVLPMRRHVGDRLGEAEALNGIAEIYNRLDNGTEAQKLIGQSLEIVNDSSLPQHQQRLRTIKAEALTSLGKLYLAQGKVAKALETAQTALAIRRQLSNWTGEGETQIVVGAAFLNLGQKSQARDALEKALKALRKPSFSPDEQESRKFYEGEVLAWIGYLEMISGSLEQASQMLDQALAVNRKTGNRSYGELSTLNSIAALQSKQSKWNRSLESYQQLLSLSREIGHRSTEGSTLISIGGVYQAQNQNDQALASYQEGLAVYREIDNRQKEVETIVAIAGVYTKQKQYQQALKEYQQALVISRDIKNRSLEASTLQLIGDTYQTLKQYPQALEKYQQALATFREIKDRSREAQALFAIGSLHHGLKQYSPALEAYQQALPLFRNLRNLWVERDPNIGQVDFLIGQIHFIIGQIYSIRGRYPESKEYLNQGLGPLQSALVEARANKNREMESSILRVILGLYESLSQNYASQQQYEQAIGYLYKGLGVAKQLGDREQEKGLFETLVVNYANQGQAYEVQRDYEGALKSSQQALKIARENGLQYWEALLLLYIGQVYSSRQDFALALNYEQKAQAIIEQTHDRSLQYKLLISRGTVYKNLLRYPEALEAIQQAQFLLQKTGDSLGAASMLTLIGVLYEAQNQYGKALDSYKQALEGLQNNPFAPFKNGINADNVEEFCAVAQKVGASEGLFSSADICDSFYALGSEALRQPFVIDGLNSVKNKLDQSLLAAKGATLHAIGQLYLEQNNYNQALASYRKALPILHQAGSLIEGATLSDIGVIERLKGQFDQALASSQRALEISQAFNHRINEEDALNNLAIVYWAQGNVASALKVLSQKAKVENENLTNNLAIGSEERKRAYIVGQPDSISLTATFHLQAASQNRDAARLALTSVLQRKGRILDAASDNVQVLYQNLQPRDRKLLDDLNTSRAALVNLFYDQRNTYTAIEFKTQVENLKSKIDKLDDALAQRSTGFRAEVQPATIEAVQASIPADAALVEFVRYSPFNPKANLINSEIWGPPRYAAALLTSKGVPKWIDLGEAAPIDQAVKQLRDGLRNQMSEPEMRDRGQAIYNRLMSKVQSELGNVRHLLISPDSQLNLVPFTALVNPQNQYLIETHTITYLSSGRDLLRLRPETANRPPQQVPVIIANPDFDRPGNSEPAQIASAPINSRPFEVVTRQVSQRSADFGSQQFARLTGTHEEAAAIAPLFPNALRLEDSQATENTLKQLHSPSILHIATHGFFFEDPPSFTQSNASAALNNENPLLRSGLALAGFNIRQSGSEDGVLTALEVSGLDLRGTRLVVLSACDTGLGGILNGEGVYGLRRALVIAGAESQMVSLWRVDDQASAKLMGQYYRLLKAGRDRSEALRQVQLEMMRIPQYSNPYFWSAFIFSGDWHKMEGF